MSIKCKNAATHQRSWHIGVTKSISVEGVTIEADSLPEVEIYAIVEMLCFPKQGFLFSSIPEPEPVKLAGRVIWQDKNKKRIGLEILTTE